LLLKHLHCLLRSFTEPDKAFCLSAAKKKEYEAFYTFRQPSFYYATASGSPARFADCGVLIGEANYSKASSTRASAFCASKFKAL
jgi:hypothetical protein